MSYLLVLTALSVFKGIIGITCIEVEYVQDTVIFPYYRKSQRQHFSEYAESAAST